MPRPNTVKILPPDLKNAVRRKLDIVSLGTTTIYVVQYNGSKYELDLDGQNIEDKDAIFYLGKEIK
jgi:hypothetical protein